MKELPYAEDVNYWQTGKSLPETWIENARKEIEAVGGKINSWVFGSETQTERSAYMIQFEVGGEKFKIIFPVLPTRSGKKRSVGSHSGGNHALSRRKGEMYDC